MAGTPVHVVPSGDAWGVRREGGDMLSTHPTQSEAEQVGRDLAKSEQVEFVLHNQAGAIREKDSYGNDPRDSKG
jgi:hypothetical protein